MAESQIIASMLSRFRGSLVGALVGDCFGDPFEFVEDITLGKVKSFVEKKEKCKKGSTIIHFTDDTEMQLSVGASLLKHKGFNAEDMADLFAKEYFASNIDRNYGSHVPSVFFYWTSEQCEDVYLPATKQFDGDGSYGNGGGMRIAPAALFMYKESPEKLKELTDKITRLTHTHPLGTLGAYLQALAVHFALKFTESPFPTQTFLDELIAIMSHYEEQTFGKSSPQTAEDSGKPYSQKLEAIKRLLDDPKVSKEEVISQLGNDVTALGSIPISIYAFLRALSNIDGLEGRNAFERTIIYAIYLEGDTDTIATMAGAIAGAYWGEESIPKAWYQNCEGLSYTQKNATGLYEYVKSIN